MRGSIRLSLFCAAVAFALLPAAAAGVDAQAAFEQLSSLAGTWHGGAQGEGKVDDEHAEDHSVVHEIKLSARGSVVMETMMPGTDHEMINMYHVDGDELVLTHYCAEGNQPKMQLNRRASTPEKLVFDFAGGTNFDPAVDMHIHSAEITLVDRKSIQSVWRAHSGGEQVAVMTFDLGRK